MSRAGLIGPTLRVARSFAGLTRAELGERVGVTATAVGQLEAGARKPTPGTVESLGAALGFSARFLGLPLADEVRDEECHLRRRAALSLAVKGRALAHATLFAGLLAHLDATVRRPVEALPEPGEPGEPAAIEAAAADCRRLWGLEADLPIPNLTRVLERAGVVVTRLPEGLTGVGAFSRVGRRLLIVLDDEPSASRARLDLAHQAGHVVLHRGVDAGDVALDEEAERFAGALLLPRAGVLDELPRGPWDWEAWLRLKQRWKVSLAALVRRAFDLRVIDVAAYQRAFQQMAARGWTASEPHEIDDEAPEVVPLALEQLETRRGVPRAEVARQLGWSARVFERVSGVELGGSGGAGKIVSLAAFRAARPDAAQTELDFGGTR
jgi:Zn-dependent peptidase ImmA (M78 family)/DNA-binding XRE family transcriptional regulator